MAKNGQKFDEHDWNEGLVKVDFYPPLGPPGPQGPPWGAPPRAPPGPPWGGGVCPGGHLAPQGLRGGQGNAQRPGDTDRLTSSPSPAPPLAKKPVFGSGTCFFLTFSASSVFVSFFDPPLPQGRKNEPYTTGPFSTIYHKYIYISRRS